MPKLLIFCNACVQYQLHSNTPIGKLLSKNIHHILELCLIRVRIRNCHPTCRLDIISRKLQSSSRPKNLSTLLSPRRNERLQRSFTRNALFISFGLAVLISILLLVIFIVQRLQIWTLLKHLPISRIRGFYLRKVKYTQQNFHDRLEMMLTEFPRLEDIHPFYSDLMGVLYDRDHYKLALGQISTAKHLIGKE